MTAAQFIHLWKNTQGGGGAEGLMGGGGEGAFFEYSAVFKMVSGKPFDVNEVGCWLLVVGCWLLVVGCWWRCL